MATKNYFNNFICKKNPRSSEFCNKDILKISNDTHKHDEIYTHTDQMTNKQLYKQKDKQENFDEKCRN